MSDKLLIDRKLLERLQERLDPHVDARDWGMVCDAFRTQQSSQGGEAVEPVELLREAVRVLDGWQSTDDLDEMQERIDAKLASL